MATDAEINLKVNVPPPKTDAIEKLLKDVQRIKGFTESYIKEAAKGSDIAEAAKVGRERAAKLGEEMAKKYEAGFADGFKNVLKFGARNAQLTKGVAAISQDITGAEAAWREGKLTDAQMLGLAEKKYSQMFTLYENAGDLKNTVAASEQDLNRNNQLEELLALNEKFNEQLVNESEGARAFARELKNAAGALEDEVEALDLSVPGNEKLKLTLLEQAKALRTRSNAAEKSAEVIEHEADVINRSIKAFDGTEKSFAKSQKEVEAATARALAQKKKLAELGAQQDVANQRQIVNEEKLSEQQQRREAAEAKRAAAEEAREKREEALQERKLYNYQLLGKSKLELAKKLKELNKERERAAEIGDKDALERLEWQANSTRAAMRQAGMQANVSRMMYLQQAQAANRLSKNLDTVSEGLANVSEDAEEGSLNLTEMASSVMDMADSFKEGQGGMFMFMLALKIVQDVINEYGKDQQKLQELEEKNTEIIDLETEALWGMKRAHEEVLKQRTRDNAVLSLKAEYADLNKVLQAGLDLINAQTAAELRRQQLTQDEAQFQRTLKKHELGRALAEGKMTKAEYDLAMLAMSEEEAIAGADASVAEAKTKIADAEKRAALANKAKNEKREKLSGVRMNHQSVSEYEWSEYEKYDAELAKKEEEASAELDALVKEWNEWEDRPFDVAGAADLMWRGWTWLTTAGGSQYRSRWERWQERSAQAKANLEAARNARHSHRSAFKKKTGTLNKGDYFGEQNKEKAQYEIAQSEYSKAEEEYWAAQSALSQAEQALKEAEASAKRTKSQAQRMRESQEKTLETEQKENKKAEKRQKKINKDLEDLQQKDLKELEALKRGFEGKRGKTEGSQRWEQYTAAALRVQEEIDRRKKGAAEAAERVEIEGMNDRSFGRGGNKKAVSSIDLAGITATMNDGILDAGELNFLVQEMKKARKAQNETAQQLIQAVVQNALETRKTAEKERKRIHKLKQEGAL